MQHTSRPVRPLRPAIRARLVRCLVRRQHQGRAQPRARAHRPRRPDQPRAPRGHGRRGRHRRRRRHPRPGPRPLPARGPARAGRRAAAGRCLRRRHGVPPGRHRGRRQGAGGDRDHRRRRGPHASSPGATCPSTRPASAPPPGRRCRRSSSCSSRDTGGRHGHRPRPQGVRRPQARSSTSSSPSSPTYFPSLSARTLVYKGMLTTPQLAAFFPDLTDERFESALLLVHSRFSTNTFPSWPLAHPYRFIAHNGEINTVQGNQNWMRAREAMLDERPRSPASSGRSRSARPAPRDTARFDEVLELLHLGGRPLHHAVLMMIPEAWENNAEMDPAQRAFYRFHSSMMEPWDGPASVAVHRRHGHRRRARPQRPAPEPLLGHRRRPRRDGVRGRRDRHRPGQGRHARAACSRAGCSSSTRRRGASSTTTRSRRTLAAEHPYARVARARASSSSPTCPTREHVVFSHDSVLRRQQLFGYTHEELKIIVAPMATSGAEPIGSMGTDTPIAVLSRAAAPAVRLLPPAVRPGHQPAARRHPRGGRHVGVVDGRPGGEPARPGPDSCRQLVAAVPDHRQRRAGQDHPRQRRAAGSPACGRTSSRASTASPAAAWRWSGRSSAICSEVSAAIDDGRPDHRALRPQHRRRSRRRSRRCC